MGKAQYVALKQAGRDIDPVFTLMGHWPGSGVDRALLCDACVFIIALFSR